MTTSQLKQTQREVYQNFNNCKRTATLVELVDDFADLMHTTSARHQF